LVADHDSDAGESLATLLHLWGYEVRVAHDRPTALKLARQFQPHVAVIDFHMGTLGQGEVLHRLRKHVTAHKLRIVDTNPDAVQDRVSHSEIACDAILPKPCNLKALQTLLAECHANHG
jgi:two-component system, sensor histidine kinase